MCRGSHWGCDGTLVVVGAGNKTAQLNVLNGSERPGVAAAQMSSSVGGPRSSEGESSVVSCLPQEFLRVNSAEVGGAWRVSGERGCLALATSPNGRFTVTVLETLRLLLEDTVSGASRVLTPPMSGSTQRATDVDVLVAVDNGGKSVVLRVVFLGDDNSHGRVLKEFDDAPLWLFVSSTDLISASSSEPPESGSWVVLPMEVLRAASTLPRTLSDASMAPARLHEALAFAGPRSSCEQAAGVCEAVRGGFWMFSEWRVTCLPTHDSPCGVNARQTPDSAALCSPNYTAVDGKIPSNARSPAEITLAGGDRPSGMVTYVQVRATRLLVEGLDAVNGMLLPRDRIGQTLEWQVRIRLPPRGLLDFESRSRRWMEGKMLRRETLVQADSKKRMWSFLRCLGQTADDSMAPDTSSRRRASDQERRRVEEKHTCADEMNGENAICPVMVRWDRHAARASVLINLSHDEALLAMLSVREGGQAVGDGRKGRSQELVMERCVTMSNILHNGRRDIIDMTWDARAMFLLVLTVDERLVMFSRTGLPCRLTKSLILHSVIDVAFFIGTPQHVRQGSGKAKDSTAARWLHDSIEHELPACHTSDDGDGDVRETAAQHAWSSGDDLTNKGLERFAKCEDVCVEISDWEYESHAEDPSRVRRSEESSSAAPPTDQNANAPRLTTRFPWSICAWLGLAGQGLRPYVSNKASRPLQDAAYDHGICRQLAHLCAHDSLPIVSLCVRGQVHLVGLPCLSVSAMIQQQLDALKSAGGGSAQPSNWRKSEAAVSLRILLTSLCVPPAMRAQTPLDLREVMSLSSSLGMLVADSADKAGLQRIFALIRDLTFQRPFSLAMSTSKELATTRSPRTASVALCHADSGKRATSNHVTQASARCAALHSPRRPVSRTPSRPHLQSIEEKVERADSAGSQTVSPGSLSEPPKRPPPSPPPPSVICSSQDVSLFIVKPGDRVMGPSDGVGGWPGTTLPSMVTWCGGGSASFASCDVRGSKDGCEDRRAAVTHLVTVILDDLLTSATRDRGVKEAGKKRGAGWRSKMPAPLRVPGSQMLDTAMPSRAHCAPHSPGVFSPFNGDSERSHLRGEVQSGRLGLAVEHFDSLGLSLSSQIWQGLVDALLERRAFREAFDTTAILCASAFTTRREEAGMWLRLARALQQALRNEDQDISHDGVAVQIPQEGVAERLQTQRLLRQLSACVLLRFSQALQQDNASKSASQQLAAWASSVPAPCAQNARVPLQVAQTFHDKNLVAPSAAHRKAQIRNVKVQEKATSEAAPQTGSDKSIQSHRQPPVGATPPRRTCVGRLDFQARVALGYPPPPARRPPSPPVRDCEGEVHDAGSASEILPGDVGTAPQATETKSKEASLAVASHETADGGITYGTGETDRLGNAAVPYETDDQVLQGPIRHTLRADLSLDSLQNSPKDSPVYSTPSTLSSISGSAGCSPAGTMLKTPQTHASSNVSSGCALGRDSAGISAVQGSKHL